MRFLWGGEERVDHDASEGHQGGPADRPGSAPGARPGRKERGLDRPTEAKGVDSIVRNAPTSER
jgi:hypothetical protein